MVVTSGTKFDDAFAATLDRLIGESEAVIRPFREKYKETMEFFAGDMYGKRDSNTPTFLNKLQQAILIYSRVLSARNPQVIIKTKNPNLSLLAHSCEAAMNASIRELELDREMQRIIIDALFYVGISKSGLCSSDDAYDMGDTRIDPGKPFISRVSPDDHFFDTTAQVISGRQFVGEYVEMDREWVLTSGYFGETEEVKAWIDSSSHASAKETGVRGISGAKRNTDTRLYPTVIMREVYLPRERKIVYMPYGTAKIVRVQDWNGSESGPYEILSFMQMPDNIMPIPMVQAWYNLARYINNLMVKIAKDAEAQKKGYVVYADSPEDGKMIEAMRNGDIITITKTLASGGAKAIGEEINVGGVNQNVFALLQWMLVQFDEVAGNLSLLGGLSAQSSTLGQDQMLNSRASVMEYDMRSQVVNFMKRTLEKYGSFLWSDPIKELRGSVKIGATEVDVGIQAEHRADIDFTDFGMEIIPYSMEFQSPKTQRAEFLEDVQIIAPFVTQNGYQLNIEKLIAGIEERGNIDNLAQIVTRIEQDPAMQMQADGAAGKNVIEYQSNVSPFKQHTEKRVSDVTNKGVASRFAAAMTGDS